MAKELSDPENWRVVIYPRDVLYFLKSGKSADEITCGTIARDVKRHIDEVASVHVECDQEYRCEHCGSRWTEDSPDYNGGCCEADELAYERVIVAENTPNTSLTKGTE